VQTPRVPTASVRSRSRTTQLAIGAVVLTALAGGALTSCNDDGRTLREPRPDQVGSVSSLAPPTTLEPTVDDGGASADGAVFDTLPAEQTIVPTSDPTAITMAPAPIDTSDLPAVTDLGPIVSSDLPAGTGDDIGGDEAVLTGPFAQDEPIDPKYTCTDDNNSPPLAWSQAPEGTVEIAVSLTDTDAPGFIHWVMAGIDPGVTSLDEAEVPEGAIVGKSSVGGDGYYGPCPPVGGGTHHYVFTVHFLMQQTELTTGAEGADLLAVVDGATFNGASLVGTYERN
jgi:Raf kinase inhibitor-like YbhB/YbcL family protein